MGWREGINIRFHEYFPVSTEVFKETSEVTCKASLKAFEGAYDNATSKAWIDLGINQERPIFQLCK